MKQQVFYIVILIFLSCNSGTKKDPAISKRSREFNRLAKISLQNKNYDSAKYYVDQALILDSTNYAAYNNRAVVNFKQHGPSNLVIEDFETALRLSPGYEIALFSLVNYYDEVRDYKKVIKAVNRYDNQKDVIDSGHTKEINRLNLRAIRYEKLIGNISIVQAITFYDSVNSILENADSLQTRFNNKLLAVARSIMNNKNTYSDFDYFNRQFDSLMTFRADEFNSIKNISEIDSSLNYKQNVLDYLTIIMDTYKVSFPRLLYCMKTKNIVLIRNCLTSMKRFSIEVKKAQSDLAKLKYAFEKKYEL